MDQKTSLLNHCNQPIVVLLDTNVWIYATKLLRTPVARAFLHALRIRNGRILLPEVYEMEIIRHAQIHGDVSFQKANNAIGNIRALSGLEVAMLPFIDFEALARDRIGELESLIVRLPFDHQHARNALARIMDSRPPSKHKKQEFKDCAAWEALLTVRDAKSIDIITEDSDFSDEPKSIKLSSELINEAKAVGLTVNLFYDIQSYLNQFADNVPIVETELLASGLLAATKSELRSYAERVDLEVQDRATLTFNAFLTDREGELGIDFVLTHSAQPIAGSEFYPDVLTVRVEGQSIFDVSKRVVSHVRLKRIVPLSTEGMELRGKLAFSSAGLCAYVGPERALRRIPEKIPL